MFIALGQRFELRSCIEMENMNFSKFHFFSEDKSNQLTLIFSGIRDDTFPVRVEIKTSEIEGGFSKAIVFKKKVVDFYHQLCELEKTRQGEAVLVATDEKELYLKIENLDSNGHMKLEVKIGSYDYSTGSPAVWNLIKWTFEIDPYSVQKITRGAKGSD